MKMKPDDIKQFAERFLVKPNTQVNMHKDFDPNESSGLERDESDEMLQAGVELLSEYQERLYAENSRALLVVIQALDAAGKDSVIKHVMSGVNPQGCQVTSFKAPSVEELDHDYLWRCVKALPARGMIGIFNRSHYEEVLVVRVHPQFLIGQRLPAGPVDKDFWQRRFEQINNFERYLVQNGTEIIKIYLHVSAEEQRQRQLERIEKPEKNWKFNANDIEERKYRSDYMQAYDDVFENTSTPWAPWYVAPADRKWYTRIVVASIIANKLIEMNPRYPAVSDAEQQKMAQCRTALMAEAASSPEAKSSPATKAS